MKLLHKKSLTQEVKSPLTHGSSLAMLGGNSLSMTNNDNYDILQTLAISLTELR